MLSELPEIFQADPSQLENPLLPATHSHSRWTEFVAHLAQFSELNIPNTLDQLEMLLASEASPQRRAILYTGVARCLINEGRFMEGASTLGSAYHMVDRDDHDAQAFVMLEMSSFMAVTAQYDLALMLLDRVPNLTKSEYLRRLANYYWLVIRTRKGDLNLLPELENSISYFLDIQETATVAYHHKNIGNVYRKQKEYDNAENQYQLGLKLARLYDYTHIESSILHDLGMLRFHQQKVAEALKILENNFSDTENQYTRCLSLGNMGFILKAQQRFPAAGSSLRKSLDIALEHNFYHIIPSIAYNLALCHQQIEHLDLAHFYFKTAYETAVELLDQKFPFTGDRKLAINGYVEFIRLHPDLEAPDLEDHHLSFTIDKTMREIRSIFQNAVLDLLVEETGSIADTIKSIGISRRTYFSVRQRGRDQAIESVPAYIREFVQNHSGKSWKELNGTFDAEILPFLYRQYGKNKKLMSNKLAISYPYAVALTTALDRQETR